MTSCLSKSLMLALLVVPTATITHADEKEEVKDEARAKAETDMKQIDSWVEQLGNQRLTKRVQAKEKLLSVGKAAIPSLAKAALSDKREMIEKSIDVLGALAQSEEEETADAARVTLKMLSESKKPSTAERARSVLNTKEADGIKPFEGWDESGNPFAGGGGGNRSVSVSSINGKRTIKIVDNGKETLIQEVARQGIRVKVEKDEGPVEILAKDEADLKKRLPEVYKLYKQHTSSPALGAGFGPAGGVFFGNGGAAANATGTQAFKWNVGGQGAANRMLVQQMKELRRRMAGNPAMQQLLDQQIQGVSGK